MSTGADIDLELTAQERLLIKNIRAMKASAKHMMFELAEDLAETLPAMSAPSDAPATEIEPHKAN
jgi:hypothetical protein